MLQALEKVDFKELQTQVNHFHDHKDEDAEDYSHRFDNIRCELEYPFTAFDIDNVEIEQRLRDNLNR